ncbi:unnamed protein product [Symbiodinium sp. CCMP2592]|nr:unnamed protein product [Symbiodinium sp. CCMP2592]
MRRLRGKQPGAFSNGERRLLKAFGHLAEPLGLGVFRIAAVSRACCCFLASDQNHDSFWRQIFEQKVCLKKIRKSDAACKALFARIPLGLQSLDLLLSKVEWHSTDRESISEETLKVLTTKLGNLKKFSLDMFCHDAEFQAELVRNLPSTLESLSLAMEMEEGVVELMAQHLPRNLSSLAVDFHMMLEGDLSVLLKAVPTCLKHLRLGLAEVLSRQDLLHLSAMIKDNAGLETLVLDLENNSDCTGEALDKVLQSLPPQLRQLELKMTNLDLKHPGLSRAFATGLAQLRHLQILVLDFEESHLDPNARFASEVLTAVQSELSECSLNFAAYHVAPGSLASIADMLSRQPCLHRLHLDLRAQEVNESVPDIARRWPNIKDLSLSFFNSDLSGPAMDVLSAALPRNLKSFKLNIDGCSALAPKNIETLFRNLPKGLAHLDLELEWKTACGAQEIQFPPLLKTLCFRCSALYEPGSNEARFVQAFCGEIQSLKLQSLKLGFEMCDISLESAAKLAKSLPTSLRKLEMDVDGVVTAADTTQRWEETLRPLQLRFGKGVRIPQEGSSSDAKRVNLSSLFALLH